MKRRNLDDLVDGYSVLIYADDDGTFVEFDTDGPLLLSFEQIQRLINAMIQLERENE